MAIKKTDLNEMSEIISAKIKNLTQNPICRLGQMDF